MAEAIVPTIFVHIQKTGGSTLRLIVRREYGADGLVRLIASEASEQLASYVASPEARATVRAIIGHGAFADRHALPIDARFVTMLREPVARVVSHHAFAQRTPHLGVGAYSQGMSLREFVESDVTRPRIHNLQTRLLGRVEPDEAITRAMLAAAKHNLEQHFAVVGLTERFDESILLMRRALGWKRWPFYERRNVTPRSAGSAPLSDDVLALIREHNALDIELYEWVARRFDDAVRVAGPRLQADLLAFQALNSTQGTIVRQWTTTARSAASARARRLKRAIRRL
jgi:hypothetical protein